MAVVCGICHEEGISEIGELDCCEHSFCHPCITQWAEIETRCPFCKSRFTQIQRKRLDLDALADAGDDALGEGDGDAVIRQRWPGTVLETTVVPERNQRNAAEGQLPEDGDEFEEDPMDTVYCTECGDGGDEACLLLCDGCDRPCHTYCAGLDGVPDGEWFCAACEERRAGQALHDPARAPAPAATGGRRTRASRGASAPSRQPAQSNATRLAMVAAERSSGGGVSQARSAPMTRRVRQRLMQRRGSRAVRVPVPAPPASPPRNMYDAAASHAHRRVDEMRGNWEALRRGHATFDHRPTSSSVSNGSRVESTAHAPPDQPEASAREQARSRAVAALAQAQFGPRQGSEDVDVSSAWSQLEAIRQQAQQAQQQQQQQRSRPSATRQRSTGYIPTGSFGSSEEDEDEEGPQHSLGSAFRAELRQARDLGRRMGPTGRVASGQRRPSMRRAPSAAFTIDHTRARMQAARASSQQAQQAQQAPLRSTAAQRAPPRSTAAQNPNRPTPQRSTAAYNPNTRSMSPLASANHADRISTGSAHPNSTSTARAVDTAHMDDRVVSSPPRRSMSIGNNPPAPPGRGASSPPHRGLSARSVGRFTSVGAPAAVPMSAGAAGTARTAEAPAAAPLQGASLRSRDAAQQSTALRAVPAACPAGAHSPAASIGMPRAATPSLSASEQLAAVLHSSTGLLPRRQRQGLQHVLHPQPNVQGSQQRQAEADAEVAPHSQPDGQGRQRRQAGRGAAFGDGKAAAAAPLGPYAAVYGHLRQAPSAAQQPAPLHSMPSSSSVPPWHHARLANGSASSAQPAQEVHMTRSHGPAPVQQAKQAQHAQQAMEEANLRELDRLLGGDETPGSSGGQQDEGGTAGTAGAAASRAQRPGGISGAAKEAVVAQVKEMLKPMYHRKAISRDEFKALAKAATAVLVRGEAQGAADAVQRAAEVTGIPVQSL